MKGITNGMDEKALLTLLSNIEKQKTKFSRSNQDLSRQHSFYTFAQKLMFG
jgi:hypothetical protein